MSSSCATCGQPPSAGCACAGSPPGMPAPDAAAPAVDPFPLEEFAPELAAPRPGVAGASRQPSGEPAPPRPVLEIVRPAARTPSAAEPGAGVTAMALAAAAADAARTGRDRGRRRLPSGIRLVIGRRRPAPPPPAPPPRTEAPSSSDAGAPEPASPGPAEALVPPPRPDAEVARAAWEARGLLVDVPAAAAPPEMPRQAAAIAPPVADADAAGASLGGLLSAFAAAEVPSPPPEPAAPAAPAARAAAPSAPRRPESSGALATLPATPPPSRVERTVRTERMRMRPRESPRADPTPGASAASLVAGMWQALGALLARAVGGVSGAASALAGAVLSPWAAAIAGVALLVGLAVAAPAMTGALLAGAAGLLARSEARAGKPASAAVERLAWAGLAVSALLAAAGLAMRWDAALPWPAGWLARPAPLVLPVGLIGLALAVDASLVLARRFRAPALAGTSLPVALVVAAQALVPATGGALLAASGLAIASVAGSDRAARTGPLRGAAIAWAAVAAGLAALGAAAAGLLAGRTPGASALVALAALTPAAAIAVLRLTRSYDDAARRAARPLALVVAGAMATLALGIGALAAGAAAGLALLPLLGSAHLALARWKARRHHPADDAPWLVVDGRALVLFGSLLAGASVAASAGSRAPLAAVALGAMAAWAAIDPALAARAATRAVAPLAALGAVLAAAASLGFPLAQLPAVAAIGLASLPVASALAGRRRFNSPEVPWTWPILAGSAACLVAALVACASGSWQAGGIGVGAALLAPLALRALPARPATGAGSGSRPNPLAVHVALAALAPAAPLLALGRADWIAPVLAVEGLAAGQLARRRPRALPAVAMLLAASLVMLPSLADREGFLPGAIALGLWCLTAALEAATALRSPARGTRVVATTASILCGLGLTAWLSAALGGAAIALLVAAVSLQAADRLASDAVVARACREAAGIAWIAAVVLSGLEILDEPVRCSLLLAGACLTSLLMAALRNDDARLLAAGLAAAGSLAAASLHLGLSPARHPAAFVVPGAAFVVGWGVLQAWRSRPFRGSLAAGLALLLAGVLLEAHLPASPPLLRAVGAALAATIVAGGIVARHRIPVIVGGLALGIEAAWLLGEGFGWVARNPLPGLTIVAAVVVAAAALGLHVSWRAGGRTPLLLAWTSDLARLREAWARWA